MRNTQDFVKKLGFLYRLKETFSVSRLLQKTAFTRVWEYCFIKTNLSTVFPPQNLQRGRYPKREKYSVSTQQSKGKMK